jgi:hypothetical protein
MIFFLDLVPFLDQDWEIRLYGDQKDGIGCKIHTRARNPASTVTRWNCFLMLWFPVKECHCISYAKRNRISRNIQPNTSNQIPGKP